MAYVNNYDRADMRKEGDQFDRPALPPAKPWLLYPRKPKNRGNAGAGMKARAFLTRLKTMGY